ncbi:probable prolyl 4-hydroxylase 7 [Cryptomeria japonica]|uniref:probable prolyl 4-hydroxylase 7 n=1 Tax=Cryptomeria japonica TaxID=3369 RepID=UPI0027DA20AD|nr:probable prolyl 4-hydroxylase 7 [Cryptomeria japonica]
MTPFAGVLIIVAMYSRFAESAMELPGWLGETYRIPLRTSKDASKLSILKYGPPSGFDPARVTQLSWHPRAFLYKNFLTDEECDHLIALSRDKMEKSMVADNESRKSVMSEIRTSSGMFLSKGQDEIVARIEERIAAWTFLPKENGEAMQILHYENGQKYEPHFDDKLNQAMGGHRIATVLMYLSDVVKWGETVFPNAESKQSQPKDDSWSECAKRGYSVKPNKGDALLFFSLHPGATTAETGWDFSSRWMSN